MVIDRVIDDQVVISNVGEGDGCSKGETIGQDGEILHYALTAEGAQP